MGQLLGIEIQFIIVCGNVHGDKGPVKQGITQKVAQIPSLAVDAGQLSFSVIAVRSTKPCRYKLRTEGYKG